VKDHQDILVVSNLGEHFELLELDIERIMIVNEEDLEFLR
jgi:hypothetical protein